VRGVPRTEAPKELWLVVFEGWTPAAPYKFYVSLEGLRRAAQEKRDVAFRKNTFKAWHIDLAKGTLKQVVI
jgi:hypothetical protein